MLTAEKFSAINHLLGYAPYPEDKLDLSWKKLIEAMDHNQNGQGGEVGDERKKENKELSILLSREMIRQCLSNIAERVEIRDRDSYPVVVFNPSSWSRTEPVIAHAAFFGDISPETIGKYREGMILTDDEGKQVACQMLSCRESISRVVEIVFTAADVPPLGYRTYYILPSDGSEKLSGNTCRVTLDMDKDADVRRSLGEDVFENDFYVLSVDKATGQVSVLDRQLDKTVIKEAEIVGVEERGGNYLTTDEMTGRVFYNQVKSVRLTENNPVRARVEIEGKVANIRVVQEIILYRDYKKIEIKNHISWEKNTYIRLQQLFPVKVRDGVINYGIPFGYCTFPQTMPGAGPYDGEEVSRQSWEKLREVQNWIDISNEEFGVALAVDHRLVEIEPSLIRAYMIRGARYCGAVVIKDGKRENQPHPPSGEYTFRYTLRSHQGDWKEANSHHDGEEIATPLISVYVADQISPKSLPAKLSFINVEPQDGVIVSAVKKADKEEALIIRMYEIKGKQVSPRIDLYHQKGSKKLKEVNLLEEAIQKSRPEIAPFEIKTLKIPLAFSKRKPTKDGRER